MVTLIHFLAIRNYKQYSYNFFVSSETILKSYCQVSFLPLSRKRSMFSVFLLLLKYMMSNVPVIEPTKSDFKNLFSRSKLLSIVLRDVREGIGLTSLLCQLLSELGELPFMYSAEVRFLLIAEFGALKCSPVLLVRLLASREMSWL